MSNTPITNKKSHYNNKRLVVKYEVKLEQCEIML